MVDTRQLTEDMRDVCEICGEDVALELLTKLPGVEVKVPARWSEANPLSRISRDKAERLIADFAGNKLYVPTHADRLDTRKIARQMAQDGQNTIDIALRLNVSERHVRNLLSGKRLPRPRKVDDRQIDLEEFINRDL
ncbi:hypothetical protein [Pseudovibrio exalbescens]|uniref:hypothetical protein n=1 Tax=Pseudovibrio exalbescens TaxID=197461 RepID=UPI000C99F9B2|nr:hypothetical protein [Pseudovibrio exalbescens]